MSQIQQTTAVPRIDTSNPRDLANWAQKFDVSPEQVLEAVNAVGDHPENVELHLKGSRSTSNSDRVARNL
jgi:hypothetical protein